MNFDYVACETFFVNNESCAFVFDGISLQWRDNRVFVHNILFIDFVHPFDSKGKCKNSNAKKEHDTVIVLYAKPQKKGKLRKCNIKLQGDHNRLTSWIKMVRSSMESINARPKWVLVFINPFSGHQNAQEIYRSKVKPLLKETNIKTCVVVTKDRSQYGEVICDGIDSYDAILAVGGDGTVSEIVNCLISHYKHSDSKSSADCRQMGLPQIKIPIAIIPCGSTDCIAYTLNGTRDVETSAMYFVLGNRTSFDVCSTVASNGQCRYFLSLFAYGYLSELIRESEKFRWMGPMRYNYAGLLTLFRAKVYECELCFTGEECRKPCSKLTKRKDSGKGENAAAASRELVPCIAPESKPCFCPFEIVGSQSEIRGEAFHISGSYFLIACANISCKSEKTPNGIAPSCEFSDGYMNIVLFQPKTICDLYKIYLRITSRDKNLTLIDLPFVTMYKTKEVRIFAVQKKSKREMANVDGELFSDSSATVRVHKDAVQFICRRD